MVDLLKTRGGESVSVLLNSYMVFDLTLFGKKNPDICKNLALGAFSQSFISSVVVVGS